MVDAAEQRHNMVESQIRPSDITDRRVVRAMQSIAREEFLPEALRSLAYFDGELALPGNGKRTELAPRVWAKLMQAAKLSENDVILDVGAATGYSAALLATIGETVVALEEDQELAKTATETLARLSVDNVAVIKGPLNIGYEKAGPYDVIMIEGAVSAPPETLLSQLKDGGRLVAILQTGGTGQACCWQRVGDAFSKRHCFDASAPFLPGFAPVEAFSF